MTAPDPVADVQLPEGFTLEASDERVVLVNKHRDPGDIFALTFLGIIVVLFAGGIGGKIFDLLGAGVGLAVASPLWGWLVVGALKRGLNSTHVVVTPGSLSVRVGPIGRAGSRELTTKDVLSFHVKSFENRSSTRGGKLLVTKSFSLYAKLQDGTELLIADPFDADAQARRLEKAIEKVFAPKTEET